MKEMDPRDKRVEYTISQRDGNNSEKRVKQEVHNGRRPPIVTAEWIAEELEKDVEEVEEELEDSTIVHSVDVSDSDRIYW